MRTGVIAKKVGMTRLFQEDGRHVPVTVLALENCQVTAHRTGDRDGYFAVQLGALDHRCAADAAMGAAIGEEVAEPLKAQAERGGQAGMPGDRHAVQAVLEAEREAHHQQRRADFDIFVVDSDGLNLKKLTTGSDANDIMPSWSPDGARIAFGSNRDGDCEIFVMDADGTNQTKLTDNPTTDWFPTWSPDGSQIAFETNRDGNFEIYVMHSSKKR